MKLFRSVGLVIATFVLIAGCGTPAGTGGQPGTPPPPAAPGTPGTTEPATAAGPEQLRFDVKTIDGKDFSGQSLAGKPAVLWFWAPWCPVCQREAPTVAKAAQASTGTTFVGVAAQDEVPAMRDFVAKYQLGTFEHLADLDAAVWKRFGVTKQPAFAFIGADGSVDVVKGTLSEQDLAARVGALSGT
ncbi:protein disulfide oxidoreductase [Amycolatopsis sp. YIM 10]|uniref:protein disulfide oxidoreductase n=1 Tax=Amycolatopsis sp. YIM 10 TaxID=2653857 RepID=UPI0012A77D83|nr:protein disulfide oxidoreductase [Amycolatopsis sp. YIM 10]QFU88358.1 Soluble secreted antigen MPT53 precursor [Amycolatopsis sp. YIM 10]